MIGKYTKLSALALLILAFAGGAAAQDKTLEWKFPAEGETGAVDKATGLRLYTLQQGARAGFKEHEGSSGAVVILPGERLGVDERMGTAAGGIDPDRMLTAMAVGLVLPLPADATKVFVSKEKLKGQLVYRWMTANGAEVCARQIPLKPFSDEHDVLFVGPCSGKEKGFAALTPENEGTTIEGYERYRPRTLAEIIRDHSDPKLLGAGGKTVLLTGDTFPSKVRLIYTGESRKISPSTKQHLGLLVKSFGVAPETIAKYETELLFTEGEDRHWLPVVKDLIPFFEKELKKGDEVILYAEWVGAQNVGGAWEWVFIVNEFQK
jgi:hypothetical protein